MGLALTFLGLHGTHSYIATLIINFSINSITTYCRIATYFYFHDFLRYLLVLYRNKIFTNMRSKLFTNIDAYDDILVVFQTFIEIMKLLSIFKLNSYFSTDGIATVAAITYFMYDFIRQSSTIHEKFYFTLCS